MSYAYVGCRTTRERNARGKGLKVYEISEATGEWKEIQCLETLPNPSYQAMDLEEKYLYSVHGDNTQVSSYKIEADGTLSALNTIEIGGKNPVFITPDRTNQYMVVAALQGGAVYVIRRNADGSLGEIVHTAHMAAILLLGTVLGGMRTIGTVTQFLMPILSGGYLLAAVIVLVQHAGQLGTAFATIFHAAWHPAAVGGGTLGTVLSAGLRHGVFSNEAGLGSSAMIHSHAVDAVHGQQGMWSMVEVFVDTMLCCTVTALVLLCTGTAGTDGISGIAAFSSVFGIGAESVLSWMIALFALATLLGWCCCGEVAVRYLGGERGVRWYRWAYCFAGGLGAVGTLSTIWTFSDLANGLMAIPNLLGILLLFHKADLPDNVYRKCTKKNCKKKRNMV